MPFIDCYFTQGFLFVTFHNYSQLFGSETYVIIIFCRIVRAFLIEEQKIVVRVLKAQQQSAKSK